MANTFLSEPGEAGDKNEKSYEQLETLETEDRNRLARREERLRQAKVAGALTGAGLGLGGEALQDQSATERLRNARQAQAQLQAQAQTAAGQAEAQRAQDSEAKGKADKKNEEAKYAFGETIIKALSIITSFVNLLIWIFPPTAPFFELIIGEPLTFLTGFLIGAIKLTQGAKRFKKYFPVLVLTYIIEACSFGIIPAYLINLSPKFKKWLYRKLDTPPVPPKA